MAVLLYAVDYDPQLPRTRLVDDDGKLVGASGNRAAAVQWIRVALLQSTDDEPAERAHMALEAGGISPVLKSHLGRHLLVPEQDRERALGLLERDAAEHGYWIRLFQ